jgi:Large polyvalent protein associated domain 25
MKTIQNILKRVEQAKAEGKSYITVRTDTVRKIIENKLYANFKCDYSYTDDYAWDAANNYGKNDSMSHESVLEVANDWLYKGRSGTRCYININKPFEISIIPYSNLSYTLTLPQIEETQKPQNETTINENITATYKLNEEMNGIELYFSAVPSENVRNELKSNGFKWSKFKKCWYAKQSEKTILFAESLVSIYNDVQDNDQHNSNQEETIQEQPTNENTETTKTNNTIPLTPKNKVRKCKHVNDRQRESIYKRLSKENVKPLNLYKYNELIVLECLNTNLDNPKPFYFLYRANGQEIGKGYDYNNNELELLFTFEDNNSQTEQKPSQNEKIKLKSITFLWSESPVIEDGHTVKTFAEADQVIKQIAAKAPNDGTYDKTSFRIEWEDGQTYEGRVDVQRKHIFDYSLSQHVKDYALYRAGMKKPSNYSQEEYESLLQTFGGIEEFKQFLNCYQLEDEEINIQEVQTPQNNNSRKVIDITNKLIEKQKEKETQEAFNYFLTNILPYTSHEDKLRLLDAQNNRKEFSNILAEITLKATMLKAQQEMKG